MKKIGGRIGKLRRAGKSLPPESAKLATFPHLISHSGIPETADSLAYEPIQRLLAVGTSDGRIKVLGQHGVEILLQSEVPEGSRQILFLTNRGTVVRVENSGSVELWSVVGGRLVCRVHVPSDAVFCVCLVPGDPYLLLGCRSGDLRVCCLVDSNGEPTTEGREVKGARLLNYRVPCSALQGEGELKSCSVCLSHAGPLALTLHSMGGVAVWNFRYQKLVVRISQDSSPRLTSCGGVSAACWAGHIYGPDYLATGHVSGDIFIWKLPVNPTGEVGVVPEIVHQCKVAPPGSQASKVLGLSYVSGESDALLVMGGQCLEEPDTLTRLDIPDPGPNNGEVSTSYGGDSLPWFGAVFGYALVPPNGSLEEYEDPVAVLVLTEGGKLMLHDFDTQNPIPFSLPLQSTAAITACRILTLGSEVPGLANEIDQQKGGELWKGSEEFGGMEDPLYKWVLSGGEGPSLDRGRGGLFYFSGHEDGATRVWEITGEAPCWIDTIPSVDIAAAMTGFKGVRAIAVGGCGEVVAIGYEKGDVRVFRYSSHPLNIETREIIGVGRAPGIAQLSQPEGYQLILQVKVHGSDIRALELDSELSLLAVGDQSGWVSMVDLNSPRLNFHQEISSSAISGVMFGSVEKGEGEKPSLYIVTGDSSLTVVDVETGKQLGSNCAWLKPKHPSLPLGIALLDSSGHPVDHESVLLMDLPWLPATTWRRDLESHSSPKSEATEGKPEVVECRMPEPLGVQGDLTVNDPCSSSDAAESGSPNALCLEKVESVFSDDFRADSPDVSEPQGDETEGAVEAVKKGGLLGKMKVGKWALTRKRDNKSAESLSSAASSPKHDDSTSAVDRMGSESGSFLGGESTSHSDSFVLTMTDRFIRIYSPESVAAGDRSVLHKVALPTPAIFAAPFRHPLLTTAGVVTISENHRVQAYSLPSLDPVEGTTLEDVIGWSLDKNPDDMEFGASRHSKALAAGFHGDIVICGEFGEMVRFGLLEGCSNSKLPGKVYDWEVASAAYSARKAALQKATAVPGQNTIGVGIKKGFGAFMDVARKARDEFDKTMKFHPARAPPPAPDLHTLFHRGELQVASSVGVTSPISPNAAGVESVDTGEGAGGEMTHVDDQLGGSKLSPKAARAQLLAGAKLEPNTDPRVRTADEIREAYGIKPRNTNAKAQRVGGIMAENLDKMKERGDKLKGLDDKTALMANEAANFADLAKQLADQQKNRKWWQM